MGCLGPTPVDKAEVYLAAAKVGGIHDNKTYKRPKNANKKYFFQKLPGKTNRVG